MSFKNWSQRGDSNPRPAVYEPTSRQRLAYRFNQQSEKALNRVSPHLCFRARKANPDKAQKILVKIGDEAVSLTEAVKKL